MKETYHILLLLSVALMFLGCSKGVVYDPIATNVDGRRVIFDEASKRYVFIDNCTPGTKSEISDYDAESLRRQNQFLDSLTVDAERRGIKQRIIYTDNNASEVQSRMKARRDYFEKLRK